MSAGKFNIRVYGIWIKNNCVMVCHESTPHKAFTKFPGGGLEYGEGLYDCLQREFQEELGIVPEMIDFYHINHHFQQSAFHIDQQIISIYYTVQCNEEPKTSIIQEIKWDEPYTIEWEWKPIDQLHPEELSFPIDKDVVKKIKAQFT